MIAFDKSVCTDLQAALSREWLETNGLGGFACGTIAGAHTRRYHGLLTAALNPPGGRMLLLSKLEETFVLGDKRIELSTNEYGGAIHPEGYRFLSSFRLGPFPTWTFEIDGVQLEKTVFMPQGSNTVQIEYKLLHAPAGIDPILELRPLIAFRDYHSTTHENNALNASVQFSESTASVQPYPDLPRLYLHHNATQFQATGYWYQNFIYRVEQERGLDFQEDLFNPFLFSWKLGFSGHAIVIASTAAQDVNQAEAERENELNRREQIAASCKLDDPLAKALTVAADQFLVRREEDWTIIAGYPWFTDWGRDTMISLPGLTLCTGRAEIAKGILRNFTGHIDKGMLPNRFVDSGDKADFNNVDATLWFFEAVRAYAAVTGDYNFIGADLYPAMVGMIDWHIQGTRYNIKMAENGLLNSGAAGMQLTWMDAKVDDWVVTPRMGQPVEIQALWYNALRIMEDLAARFSDAERSKKYSSMAALACDSFNQIFWNEKDQCLYDVIHDHERDASIRPNQIFAVSLHHSILAQERARAVVNQVERELLTPVGLRTLSRHRSPISRKI